MQLAKEIYDPIERTSTPTFGKSTSFKEDPFYARFKSKLEAPLQKGTLRGIYGPKNDFINGHFVMKNQEPRTRDYTFVMVFSRDFIVPHAINLSRSEGNTDHTNCKYHTPVPVAHEDIKQLHPMFFLPVKCV